jgi:hypothetical protein
MNLFRDLYTHIVWVGGEFMRETLNILVFAGGKEYHIVEQYYDFKLSGFWKIDHDSHIYRPNKRWDLLYDDYDPNEIQYGSWYCGQCGREMTVDRYNEQQLNCAGCYNLVNVGYKVEITG